MAQTKSMTGEFRGLRMAGSVDRSYVPAHVLEAFQDVGSLDMNVFVRHLRGVSFTEDGRGKDEVRHLNLLKVVVTSAGNRCRQIHYKLNGPA